MRTRSNQFSAEPLGRHGAHHTPAGSVAGAVSLRTRVRGVEARSTRKHSGQEAALHHGWLAVHVGEVGGKPALGIGRGGVVGFAEE
jgi:hypothetical protein